MIEKIVLDYLNETLNVNAYMEIPNENETSFVVIEKTGSGERNHIFDATIAVQSYGETLYEAALLNEEVKTAMDNIIELDEVCSCDLNSDYNFTDTTTKQYRYQAVFDLVHY